MESKPPAHYAIDQLNTEDVKGIEYVAKQEGFDCEYRQLTPGSYHGRITCAVLDEAMVFKERHSQSVFVSGAGPVDDYEFGILLDDLTEQRYQGTQPGPSDVIVVQPGTAFDLVLPGNVDLLYVQLPRLQTSLICKAAGIGVRQLDQQLLRVSPLVRQNFVQALQLTMEPLSSLDPARAHAQSMTTKQRLLEVLTYVVLSPGSSNASSDRRPSPNATPVLARKIRDRMEASLDEPLQMIDLCGELNCKLRTLHYAFTSYFGVPPSAYHKKSRMNAARIALQDSDPDSKTVTNIATQYGFWHLGRFSVDYKRMFGELPSQTLATKKPRFKYTSLRQAADWPDNFGART